MRWLALLALTACSGAVVASQPDAGLEPPPQPTATAPSGDAGAPDATDAATASPDAGQCPLRPASTQPIDTCTAVERPCCSSAWSCLSDAGPARPDAECTELGGGVTTIPATGERFWTTEHCCATLSH